MLCAQHDSSLKYLVPRVRILKSNNNKIISSLLCVIVYPHLALVLFNIMKQLLPVLYVLFESVNPFKFTNPFECLNSHFCNGYLLFFVSGILDCTFGMYAIFQVCSFFHVSLFMGLSGCKPVKFVCFGVFYWTKRNASNKWWLFNLKLFFRKVKICIKMKASRTATHLSLFDWCLSGWSTVA